MTKSLQQYFPQIRTKDEILKEIKETPNLRMIYNGWMPEEQERFLDMCSGMRGVKVLYDSFFKEVFDVTRNKERLESLLSTLLEQKIKILQVLPPESSRISDESSAMIMDILVELKDGSIANVECQRVGYYFPGQRAACYSADLLMRQYRRVKQKQKEAGKKFSYADIKKVYTIIFFVKSSEEFRKDQEHYIHHSRQKMDTEVEIDLLQEYTFVTLDIFQKVMQNKSVQSDLEAWLMFLSTDNLEEIEDLLEHYPQFGDLYDDIYKLCCNTEKVMGMFSEELKILDENTMQYMLEDYEKKVDAAEKRADEEHQNAVAEHQRADEEHQTADKAIKWIIQKKQSENATKEENTRALMDICDLDEKTAKEKVELYWE